MCVFFTVMVIGAFALCYLPAVICVGLTAKLGPSRVPIALRSTLVLMVAINSALNPIIYMLRSNEFKGAFRKIFKGATIEPQFGLPPVESPTSSTRNDRPPLFLAVLNEDATFPEPRSELPETATPAQEALPSRSRSGEDHIF